MTKERRLLTYLFLFLLSSGQIWQDMTSRKNAEGNALYQQKNYGGALQKYIEAQEGSKYLPEISYNIANTLYQQKKFPEAIKELERSISNQKQSFNQRVYFNQGNSFYRVGQYQQAVESYKKTLAIDPSDREAKHNLELALGKLQENPQQQRPDSSRKDQKQEKQQPEQNQKGQSQQQRQGSREPEAQKQEQGEQQNQKTDQKQNAGQQNQPQKGEQQPGIDPKEALRILEAINNQEKKEQRRQILKLQKKHLSGRDW
jgi:Ca-activated chloride channel homolog